MKRMTWALAACIGLGVLTTSAAVNAESKVPVRTAQLGSDNAAQVELTGYGRGWGGYGRGWSNYGRGYYGRSYYGYRAAPRYYGYRNNYYRPYYGYRNYNRPYYYGYRPYYGYGSGVYLRF